MPIAKCTSVLSAAFVAAAFTTCSSVPVLLAASARPATTAFVAKVSPTPIYVMTPPPTNKSGSIVHDNFSKPLRGKYEIHCYTDPDEHGRPKTTCIAVPRK